MSSDFTFIDLFAGIGGFHQAMASLGGRCVFASEIDANARKTYEYNYKSSSPELFSSGSFNEDIKSVMPSEIPDFDILCGGFPCQPFSQAGKKLGFSDANKSERGNLFFDIADIIAAKKPKAFFLENVRGLVNHDGGRTFKTIQQILVDELGYSFYYKVVKASDYGLPQLRPRVFIVGFREGAELKDFDFPDSIPLKYTMSDVWGGECSREIGFTLRVGGRGSSITDRRNWDSYLVDGEVCRLTSTEGKRMQGFPDDFHFPVSESAAMKQLGNSVAVDAVREVGRSVLDYLAHLEKSNQNDDSTAPSSLTPSAKGVMLMPLDEFKHGKLSVSLNELFSKHSFAELMSSLESSEGSLNECGLLLTRSTLGVSCSSSLSTDSSCISSHSFAPNHNFVPASGSTNFIYKIKGLNESQVAQINEMSSSDLIKDRISAVLEQGGTFEYFKAEKKAVESNLSQLSESLSPLLGSILFAFYSRELATWSEVLSSGVTDVSAHPSDLGLDKPEFKNLLKRFLTGVILGLFTDKKCSIDKLSSQFLVSVPSSESEGIELVDIEALSESLFNNTKFHHPSSIRHKFGTIIQDNGEYFFKLNLQLFYQS